MFHVLRAMLVVAGLFGLVAAPFVGVMLTLLVTGASSGLIVGLGFVAMLVSFTLAFSRRGQQFLGDRLRRATQRS